MKGTIKWYNKEKGYGFIRGEDSKDLFFHYSALPKYMENVREEDNLKVEFDLVDTDRGPQAQKIKFVDDGSSDIDETESNSSEDSGSDDE